MKVSPNQMFQKTVTANRTKSLTSLAKRCKTLNQLKQIHAHILKTYLFENPLAIGPLLSVSAISKNPSFFSYARLIFYHSSHRNIFMYNTMIRGYMEANLPKFSVICYLHMLNMRFEANNYTFPPLIKACILLGPLEKFGLLVHAHVVKFGFSEDPFVVSSLIEYYSSLRKMGTARMLFDKSPDRDVVMCTAMIDGYGKMGDVEKARDLFDKLPLRNAVSWSAIMAAYSRISDFKEVLSLFRQMQEVGVKPNESCLVSVLTACSHLSAVNQGLWVHSYVKQYHLDNNVILATALVDMYSKFGRVDSAVSMFEGISNKDAGAWNAMISGVAMNGDATKSLELFDRMLKSGTRPTETTFVAVLTTCTHAKMVKEGLNLFAQMSSVYGIKPQLEHYACVVDLMARAGMVEDAEKFIEGKMGGLGNGDANVWGALLSACRTYGKVEVGNRVWRKLAEMQVTDSGTRVLSYNIYKEAGWDAEANKVRKLISETGTKKKPGCSVIEVNGVVEEFLAGDNRHPRTGEIYKMTDSFFQMKNLVEVL